MLLINPWCYQKTVVDKYSQETYFSVNIVAQDILIKMYSMHVV